MSKIMNYYVVAKTDAGIVKEVNQDSLTLKLVRVKDGKVVFAVICDGMGGLQKGEEASGSLVKAMSDWFYESFLTNMEECNIHKQWQELLSKENEKIRLFGDSHGVVLGTTICALLIYKKYYYLVNVGDSRAYSFVKGKVRQLTQDQTVVADEVRRGLLTQEQALTDKRRSVLLQCVGVHKKVRPDFYSGNIHADDIFMLCSDGFHHMLSEEELTEAFVPEKMQSQEHMESIASTLIEKDKERMERDNISVIAIRAFEEEE